MLIALITYIMVEGYTFNFVDHTPDCNHIKS